MPQFSFSPAERSKQYAVWTGGQYKEKMVGYDYAIDLDSDTLDKAIEVTRIGKTTADAAKAFPPASKWGYKDEAEVLSIEFGHGIGLEPHELHTFPPTSRGHWLPG
jgi:hypothetical protein